MKPGKVATIALSVLAIAVMVTGTALAASAIDKDKHISFQGTIQEVETDEVLFPTIYLHGNGSGRSNAGKPSRSNRSCSCPVSAHGVAKATAESSYQERGPAARAAAGNRSSKRATTSRGSAKVEPPAIWSRTNFVPHRSISWRATISSQGMKRGWWPARTRKVMERCRPRSDQPTVSA